MVSSVSFKPLTVTLVFCLFTRLRFLTLLIYYYLLVYFRDYKDQNSFLGWMQKYFQVFLTCRVVMFHRPKLVFSCIHLFRIKPLFLKQNKINILKTDKWSVKTLTTVSTSSRQVLLLSLIYYYVIYHWSCSKDCLVVQKYSKIEKVQQLFQCFKCCKTKKILHYVAL